VIGPARGSRRWWWIPKFAITATNHQNSMSKTKLKKADCKAPETPPQNRALLRTDIRTLPTARPAPMKRRPGSLSRSILAWLVLSAISYQLSACAMITVTGLVSQITSEALETKIMFTPAQDILLLTNGLSAGPAKTISSASNGGFTNTFNPGTYLVRLPLVDGRNAFTIAVPHGDGYMNITSLIAAPWTYEQFVNTIPVEGGTSGALTNNETRDVTFTEDVAVQGTLSAPTISGANASISAITAVTVTASGGISGSISGGDINSGTVADARIASTITRDPEMNAADTVVSNGVVSGLAAGSYAINGELLTNIVNQGIHALYVSPSGNNSTAVRGDITKPYATLYDFNGTTRSGVCSVATNLDTIFVIGTNYSAYVPLEPGVTLRGLNTNSAIFYTNRMLFTNNIETWKTATGIANGPDHPMIAMSERCVLRDLFIYARNGSFVTNDPSSISTLPNFITPFASGVGYGNAPETWILNNTNYSQFSPYSEYSQLGFTNKPGKGMLVANCEVWANVDVVYDNWFGYSYVYHGSTNDPSYNAGTYTGTEWGATESAMTWTTNFYIVPAVELTIDKSTRFHTYWDYIVVSGVELFVDFQGTAYSHGWGHLGRGLSRGPSVNIYGNGAYKDSGVHFISSVTNKSIPNCQSLIGQGPILLQGATFYNSNTTATAIQTPSGVSGNYFDGLAAQAYSFGTTASFVDNLSAPTSISIGSSPYTWTNTNSVQTQVFIYGGTISATSLNGGAIGTTGAQSVTLQPGETVSVTYSSTPTMKYKKL
jgi:hypothetical protein